MKKLIMIFIIGILLLSINVNADTFGDSLYANEAGVNGTINYDVSFSGWGDDYIKYDDNILEFVSAKILNETNTQVIGDATDLINYNKGRIEIKEEEDTDYHNLRFIFKVKKMPASGITSVRFTNFDPQSIKIVSDRVECPKCEVCEKCEKCETCPKCEICEKCDYSKVETNVKECPECPVCNNSNNKDIAKNILLICSLLTNCILGVILVLYLTNKSKNKINV